MDRFVNIERVERSSMDCLLEVKYKPRKISEWLENECQIDSIIDFVKSDKNQFLVVTGEGSTGKSTIVDLVVNDCPELEVFRVGSCQLLKLNKSYFKNISRTSDLVLIDDVEIFFTMENTHSKSLLTDFVSLGYKGVFIVSELYVTKLEGLLKKGVHKLVRMQRPSVERLLSRCEFICQNENLSSHPESLRDFVVANRCNYRYIVNSLAHYEAIDVISKFNDTCMYTAYDQSINAKTMNDRLRYFQLETGTIPIIAHENIFDMKLSQESLFASVNRMSMADVYHRQCFPHVEDIQLSTYGVMSTVFLHAEKPIMKKPRFGIIWSKQAAKFQKRKYLQDFIVSNRYRPFCFDELYHMFALLNDHVARSSNALSGFVLSLNCLNTKSLFSLYNGFTFRTEKKLNKKVFTEMIN